MDGEVKTQATGAKPGRSLLTWLRRRRRRARAHRAPRARAKRILSASRLIVVLAVLAMGATMLAGAIGYELARQSDERLWAEQRASLRNAIGEFRTSVRQSRRGRSALRAHARAERRPQGPQIRNRPGRERARATAGDGRARAHRRIPDLGESPSDAARDAAVDAAHRRHRRRAGGLCRIFAAPARARAARTGGERAAGAARRRRGQADRPAEPRQDARIARPRVLAERAGDDVDDLRADRSRRHGGCQCAARRARRRRARCRNGGASAASAAGGRSMRPHRQRRVRGGVHGRPATSMPAPSCAPPSTPSRARIGSIPWCASVRMPATRRRRATPRPAAR